MQESRKLLETSRTQLTEEFRLRTQSEQQMHVSKQEHADTVLKIEQEWRARQAKLESLLAHHDIEISRLLHANTELEEKGQQSLAVQNQLQAEIDAHRHALELAIVHAQGFEQECVSLESTRQSHLDQLNDWESAVANATAAQKTAEDSLAQVRCEMAKLQERCQQAEQSLADQNTKTMATQRADIPPTNEAGQRDNATDLRLNGLSKRSENQEHTIKQLRRQLTQAEDRNAQRAKDEEANREELMRHAQESQLQNTELAREFRLRLDAVLQQRDEAFDQVKGLHADLTRMQIHAQSDESTIRNLRKERSEVLLQTRKHKSDFPRIHGADLKEIQFADELSKAYGGTTKSDFHRGVIFLEPPRRQDDLLEINGINTQIAERLKELGIFAFSQIGAWSDDAVIQFSDLLSLDDHIRRDCWRQQATGLHEQASASRDVA